MRTILAALTAITLAMCTVAAQAPARPAFEVASINTAPPLTRDSIRSGTARIGLTVNDARVDLAYLSLADLLPLAYRVKPYQISSPAWTKESRFDIRATLPAGANRDQVPEMLQSLLAERFGLVVHTESREMPVYALVVSKEGSRLKAAAPQPAAPAEPPPADLVVGSGDNQVRMSKTADGLTMTTAKTGPMRIRMGDAGSLQMEMTRITMPEVVEFLTTLVGRPVLDRTALTGAYEFAIDLPLSDVLALASSSGAAQALGLPPNLAALSGAPGAAAEPSGNGVFQAVQKLGLRLDSERAPIEVVVVDHIEKTPTAN